MVPPVEAEAIRTWARLRPDNARAALEPLLKRNSHREQIRTAALQGIGEQQDPADVELLLSWTTRGKARECRAAALQALGSIARGGALHGTKLLVMGEGTCLLDGTLKNPQANLFYNATNWLIERRSMVAIPMAKIENTPSNITAPQQRVLLASTVFVLPALLFFGGLGYTILRRRRT